LPTPDIIPDNNFNGTPIILEADNSYSVSGNLTKIVGRHTLRFGGEARRIEWDYAQTNSARSTYTFDSGFTSEFPLAASATTGSPSKTVTQPDANGNFSMQYFYPGAYRIATTDAPAPYYLDSIRVGEAEPSTPEVEMGGPLAITLVYKTNGGTVRGTVENCRSGQVLLVPEDPAMRRPGFFRWAPCGGAAGPDRYEVGAVRPGDYYALALASGGVTPRPVIALAIAGKFDALFNQAERVQVRAGEASSADLKAIRRLAY
jgi:hypothetical protein